MSDREKDTYQSVKEIRNAYIATPELISFPKEDSEEANLLDRFSSKISDILESELPDSDLDQSDK